MEKTKRAQAVKKVEAELKEEKEAEIKRRREITMERKKAAAERERIEADKAKVRSFSPFSLSSCVVVPRCGKHAFLGLGQT